MTDKNVIAMVYEYVHRDVYPSVMKELRLCTMDIRTLEGVNPDIVKQVEIHRCKECKEQWTRMKFCGYDLQLAFKINK